MKLTTKEIAFLSQAFTDQTAISLFANIKAKPDGSELESLTKKGIIVGDGYSPEALEILNGISNPKKCNRLIIQNDNFIIEKYSYPLGDNLILVENDSGELNITKITDLENTVLSLSALFSLSEIKTTDVKVSLKPDEMVLLLTLIDIYRKNTLKNYVGEKNEAESVSLAEIQSELAKGFENGLAQALTKNFKSTKKPSKEEAEKLLESLIKKKYVVLNKGYTLNNSLSFMATNFLIPHSMIMSEIFEITDKEEYYNSVSLFIVAGIHDVISIIFDIGEINLTAISPSQMLAALTQFMYCPSIVEEAPIKPVAVKPALPDSSWVCACGHTNTGNFCAGCGAKKQ